VARSTVFREFGTKHGLARALVAREADRLLGEIARALAHSRSWDVGLLGAFRATLRAREASPLLAAVLSTDHDDAALLSFLTVRSAPILAEARRLLSTYLRAHHPPRPDVVLEDAVDTLVRAAVSYVLVPELDRDDTAERLLGLAHRLLAAPLDHLAPAHRSSRPG
jgi:AcrR family transcriptional regulator